MENRLYVSSLFFLPFIQITKGSAFPFSFSFSFFSVFPHCMDISPDSFSFFLRLSVSLRFLLLPSPLPYLSFGGSPSFWFLPLLRVVSFFPPLSSLQSIGLSSPFFYGRSSFWRVCRLRRFSLLFFSWQGVPLAFFSLFPMSCLSSPLPGDSWRRQAYGLFLFPFFFGAARVGWSA